MIYTLQQILEESGPTGNSLDAVDTDDLPILYTKKLVHTSEILDAQQDFERLTVNDWLDHCRQVTINDEPWEDTQGLETIRKLIERYSKELEVFPILVSETMEVIDGTHRLVALNSLGIEHTLVYFPLKGA